MGLRDVAYAIMYICMYEREKKTCIKHKMVRVDDKKFSHISSR